MKTDQESNLIADACIPNSDVPDILLAFADGFEEHIKANRAGVVIQRMNNHDLQTPDHQHWGFAPMFVLTRTPHLPKLLYINIGSLCVEFWDQDCIIAQTTEKVSGGGSIPTSAKIVPMYTLNYSDPNLLQQIIETINIHFEGKL